MDPTHKQVPTSGISKVITTHRVLGERVSGGKESEGKNEKGGSDESRDGITK